MRGGVCPAGSRGCRAPVIHMVIVRGPARARPRISSPIPLSGARCQLGRRAEEKREGRGVLFVCLLACFVLFKGVFADHSREWPRNATVLRCAGQTGRLNQRWSEGYGPFDGMRFR